MAPNNSHYKPPRRGQNSGNLKRRTVREVNQESSATRNKRIGSQRKAKIDHLLFLSLCTSLQIGNIQRRHKRRHAAGKSVNLHPKTKKNTNFKGSNFFSPPRNKKGSSSFAQTSREMPSGLRWESLGGRDFFSWGVGKPVLGRPSMSLASMEDDGDEEEETAEETSSVGRITPH